MPPLPVRLKRFAGGCVEIGRDREGVERGFWIICSIIVMRLSIELPDMVAVVLPFFPTSLALPSDGAVAGCVPVGSIDFPSGLLVPAAPTAKVEELTSEHGRVNKAPEANNPVPVGGGKRHETSGAPHCIHCTTALRI